MHRSCLAMLSLACPNLAMSATPSAPLQVTLASNATTRAASSAGAATMTKPMKAGTSTTHRLSA